MPFSSMFPFRVFSYRCCVKIFYKTGEKTRLSEAENGTGMKERTLCWKYAKMRGFLSCWLLVGWFFLLFAESILNEKRYIRVIKTHCLFFARSIFTSKNMSFREQNRSSCKLKSCTKPMCVLFLNLTHAHPMADKVQKHVLPLLFRIFLL